MSPLRLGLNRSGTTHLGHGPMITLFTGPMSQVPRAHPTQEGASPSAGAKPVRAGPFRSRAPANARRIASRGVMYDGRQSLMPFQELADFRSAHARLIARLRAQSRADRWALAAGDFADALYR